MNTIKKSILILGMGLWMMSCIEAGAPNKAVRAVFVKEFGEVKAVKWTHNVDYSYAHFVQNGKSVVAVFGNDDGHLMEIDPAKPL